MPAAQWLPGRRYTVQVSSKPIHLMIECYRFSKYFKPFYGTQFFLILSATNWSQLLQSWNINYTNSGIVSMQYNHLHKRFISLFSIISFKYWKKKKNFKYLFRYPQLFLLNIEKPNQFSRKQHLHQLLSILKNWYYQYFEFSEAPHCRNQ